MCSHIKFTCSRIDEGWKNDGPVEKLAVQKSSFYDESHLKKHVTDVMTYLEGRCS